MSFLLSNDPYPFEDYQPSLHLAGMVLTSMKFLVPLDYNDPDGEQITIFLRKVVALGKQESNLPMLLYLQGGPGPEGRYGWIKRATDEYQVLLLDQRGCGASSPITHQTLCSSAFESAEEQAIYLTHFRADSIVKDCEVIRRTLLGENGKWSVIGQSYGGFCLTHYLSVAPYGIREALFAGGIPPIMLNHPDDVYRLTYRRVYEHNKLFYTRYPGDVAKARRIVDYLKRNVVELPAGGILTPRRFQQLGIAFGLGTFEKVHYLIESAFVSVRKKVNGTIVDEEELSFAFLRGVENMLDFDLNPIYAILHESIYCQASDSNWSAERVAREFPQFIIDSMGENQPILFLGEMVFEWMFDDYKYLQPLKEAAQLLAKKKDWPVLYDLSQLEKNEVPCAAIVYYDDMYVPRELAEETAARIRGMKIWMTNEYNHSGLNTGGEIILTRLLQMIRGH